MKLETLEAKLKEVQNSIPKNEEVFIPIPEFKNYEVSNFGRVRSIGFYVKKAVPRNQNKITKYFYKPCVLKPLKAGENGRWRAYRLVPKQGEWKQVSIQKLMLSSFLKIKLNKLPRIVYKINKYDFDDNSIYNLSFFFK